MFTVSDEILRDFCRVPLDELSSAAAHELAYGVLGPCLARWLLRPEVLERVADHDRKRGNPECRQFWLERPNLPAGRGACWVVFAQEDYPLLRAGLVLPLQWRENAPHSHRLPAALRELADDVLRAASVESFGLHGSTEAGIDRCDLAGLGRVRCESAWASLFASLVIAAEGGLPDSSVWASGQWSAEKGIQPVGQLDAKLDAACQWGCRRFFVPTSQRVEAETWASRRGVKMSIGELTEGKPDGRHALRSALQEYLAEFGAPPHRHAPPEARKRYYLRQTDPQKRRDYYRDCILEDVAADCREQLKQAGTLPAPTHMVTILSDSPELIELAVAIFRPARVLVLHTPDKQPLMRETQKAVSRRMPECDLIGRSFESGPGMIPQMRAAIDEFTQRAAPEAVVFDLVPGTKEMTLALAMELARPGVWLYYLRHRLECRVVVPFEQTPVLWIAGRAGRRAG